MRAANDGKFKDLTSGYFHSDAYYIQRNVDAASDLLEDLDFDTIVCMGISGLIFSSPLAMAMDKHLLVVRKDVDSSHGKFIAEGHLGRRWLFVDDFISGGTTFKNVNNAIEMICEGKWYSDSNIYRPHFEFDTHCVGIYEYEREGFKPSSKKPYDAGNGSYQAIDWSEVR